MRRCRVRSALASGLTVLALAVAGPALAQGEKEDLTGLEHLRVAVRGLQGQMTASRSKLRKNMGALGEQGTSAGIQTPAMACCFSHIDIMNAKLVLAQESVQALGAYYSHAADPAGLDQLRLIRNSANRLATGVRLFEEALTISQAELTLEGMLRPINEMHAAVVKLETQHAMTHEQWKAFVEVVTQDPAKKKKAKKG